MRMPASLFWVLLASSASQGLGQILLQTIQIESDVKGLAWHPDGSFLAAAGGDTVTIFNETYAVIETLTTLRPIGSGFYDSFKEAVDFSSDGRYMCTGSDDETTEIYSTTGLSKVEDLEDAGPFCRFSPDSTEVATTGALGNDNEDLKIWAVDSWVVTTTPVNTPEGAFFLEWSPDGTMLAADDPVSKSIFIFETATWTRVRRLTGVFDYDALAWSADSKLLAVSGGTRPQGAIQIYNTSSWEIKEELIAHESFVRAMAFSPDGSQLVSGGNNGTIFLWSTEDWQVKGSLDRHTDSIRALAYSTDGTKLASGGNERVVYVWNPAIVADEPSGAPSTPPGATPAPTAQATCSLCAGGAAPPDPDRAISFFDRVAGETVETTCGELAVSDRFLFREGEYCYGDQLSIGMDRCGCEPPITFCDSICADPNASPTAACGRARNLFFSEQFKYLLYDVDGKEYDQATCDFNRYVAYANDAGCDCTVPIDSCTICPDGSAINPSQDEANSCQRIQAALVQVPANSDYCPVVQEQYGIRCGCGSGPSQMLPADNQCSLCGNGQVKSFCAEIAENQKFLPADTYLCDAETIKQVTSPQGCCLAGAPQASPTQAPPTTSSPSVSGAPSVEPTAAVSLAPSQAPTIAPSGTPSSSSEPTTSLSTAPSSIVSSEEPTTSSSSAPSSSSAEPSPIPPSESPSMSPPTSAAVRRGEMCALVSIVALLVF